MSTGSNTYSISATLKGILVSHGGDVLHSVCMGAMDGPRARELVRRGNAHDMLILALRAARDALFNPMEGQDGQMPLYTTISAALEQ